ncbi:MAG: poly-beta-1,6-N-acetyl-D-glucosamine biosynthesis protein PgaD [Gammaproteobacteria bacterium]|nr:poly-beta-1,6-N-acetyl-D-glucosamine biosynthesis protein PgaD [Gammaproteobacteria bacterium]
MPETAARPVSLPGPASRPDQPPIIERPDLQSLVQRYGSWSLTLIFWGIYLYLWLPALSALAWLAEGHFVYSQIVMYPGWSVLGRLLLTYLLVIVCLSGALIVWARINQHRFSGVERRQPPEAVGEADLASDFEVPLAMVRLWHRDRRVVLHFDGHGRIVTPAQARAAATRIHGDAA